MLSYYFLRAKSKFLKLRWPAAGRSSRGRNFVRNFVNLKKIHFDKTLLKSSQRGRLRCYKVVWGSIRYSSVNFDTWFCVLELPRTSQHLVTEACGSRSVRKITVNSLPVRIRFFMRDLKPYPNPVPRKFSLFCKDLFSRKVMFIPISLKGSEIMIGPSELCYLNNYTRKHTYFTNDF